jgi:hypothetical protein
MDTDAAWAASIRRQRHIGDFITMANQFAGKAPSEIPALKPDRLCGLQNYVVVSEDLFCLSGCPPASAT